MGVVGGIVGGPIDISNERTARQVTLAGGIIGGWRGFCSCNIGANGEPAGVLQGMQCVNAVRHGTMCAPEIHTTLLSFENLHLYYRTRVGTNKV
jgi:hypothetical protein